MRYRLMATYRGVPYEAGVGPANSDVVLFAACPPPETLGFEPATGHWRKQVIRAEIDALWESRPVGVFCGEPCIVLDDLGDRLHVAYLGTDADRARQLGYWQVDRGVFEVLTPKDEVTGLTEERVDRPLRWSEQPGSSPARTAYPYGTAPWPTLVTPALPPAPAPPPAPASLPAGVPPLAAVPPLAPETSPAPAPVPPSAAAAPPEPQATHAATPASPAPDPLAGPVPDALPGADPHPPALPPDPISPALSADPYLAETGAQPLPAPSAAGTPGPAAAGLPSRPAPAGPAPAEPAPAEPAGFVSDLPAPSGRYPANGAWPLPGSMSGPAFPPPAANGLPATGRRAVVDYPGHTYPGEPTGPTGTDLGGRAGRRQRVPTRELFCELADLASIPRSAYALETEMDGAMCLLAAPAGFEVFTAAGGVRHEVRTFAEEETAYFYLFGVLAAEAIRNGALAPAVAGAGLRQDGG
jgi:hypothetical protein